MKLLVVSQYFWPENFRINEISCSLAGKGIDVHVLTGKPNYPDGRVFAGYSAWGGGVESHQGMSVYRVPIVPRGFKRPFQLALNYLSFIVSASMLGPLLLRRTAIDVILVYAPSPLLQALPALLLAHIKKCPLVVWVQDLWPESLEATGYIRNGVVIRAVTEIVKFIYSRTDLIMVSSRPFESSIRRYVPSGRIAYYPNSVDASFCDPESGIKLSLPVLEGGFNIVFAGNVGAAQAVSVIADAAALLREYSEIRLVVLGSGSEVGWLKEQAVGRRLTNLHVEGRFPVEAMPFLLQKASALLVTLSDRPIFAATVPNKIQAYMAVGRPIIACLAGEGARIVVDANAGIAVPAEDASALAKAIIKLYEAPVEQRDAMGKNAQAYYRKHFDHETLVYDLIAHLNDVTGSCK